MTWWLDLVRHWIEEGAKYGVVGHNVILAARIESETEGGQVLVSRATHDSCSGLLEIGDECSVRLKGFDHDVPLFNVVGIGGRYDLRLPHGRISAEGDSERGAGSRST